MNANIHYVTKIQLMPTQTLIPGGKTVTREILIWSDNGTNEKVCYAFTLFSEDRSALSI